MDAPVADTSRSPSSPSSAAHPRRHRWRCASAAWSWHRRSCCCRAASASARNTRASRLQQPRRGRHCAQGHHRCSRAWATHRTGYTKPPPACSTPSACKTRASITSSRRILPTSGLHRDTIHRQRLRFHHRGVRGSHAPLRRLAHRCDRDQHLLPQHQAGRRAVRQCAGDVGTRGRSLPPCHRQTADHQTVAQPGRHPRERPRLHRGRHRRLRGHQHRHRHGGRPGEPPPGARQWPGRAVGPGDQADRAAQGQRSVRGRRPEEAFPSSARAASPARRTRSSSSSRAPAPSAWARRCSTTRCCASTVNAGLAQYLESQDTGSITQLVGTLQMGAPVPGAAC